MMNVLYVNKYKKCNFKWINCLKLITTISCVIGFVLNSMVIFRHFVENKTITSINKELHSKLPFPSLTVCSGNAFKTRITSFDGLTMEKFKNNTMELMDLIAYVYTISDTGIYENSLTIYDEFNGERYNSDTWHISTVYSQYRGRCYTIEFQKEVPIKYLWGLVPTNNSEFYVIAHDRGEEYFVHHEVWPIIPRIHLVRKDDYGIDLLFQKDTNQNTGSNCQKDSYRYFDCLRTTLSVELDSIGHICNLPWIHSMTDARSKQGLSPTIIPTCNSNEEYVASQMFLHNFSAIAADYGHPSCLAPCKTSTFQMGVKSFRKQDIINLNGMGDYRVVHVSYSKTLVTEMTTSKLVDTATFISSIGGNLGLFVGFSFINGFFFLYDYAEKLMK